MVEMGGTLVRTLPPERQHRVTGTVVYIHPTNHWYRVRYFAPGIETPQHECLWSPIPPEAVMPFKHGTHWDQPTHPRLQPRKPRGRPRKIAVNE